MIESRPVSSAVRLVVLADSLAFTGSAGPALPDDPTLYPNVAASALGTVLGRPVTPTVLAHPGSGVRDAWYALTKNRHVMFEVMMGADAVVVGIGSFDHAPLGVPSWVEALVPFVRPSWARRRVRTALRAAHPWVIRATGGRLTRESRAEFARLYDGVLFQVRSLTHGVPSAVLGPTSHRSGYYGRVHPQREERERITFEIAARHGFATVPSWPLVSPFAEKLNSDGIHWPAEGHEAVGLALADALAAQFRGDASTPAMPTISEPRPWEPGPA